MKKKAGNEGFESSLATYVISHKITRTQSFKRVRHDKKKKGNEVLDQVRHSGGNCRIFSQVSSLIRLKKKKVILYHFEASTTKDPKLQKAFIVIEKGKECFDPIGHSSGSCGLQKDKWKLWASKRRK